jgi:hypothetical protein
VGYDVNMAPPRSWYCGEVFIDKAKAILQTISVENCEVNDVAKCIEARINIMRGMRVALGLLAEDNSSGSSLLEGLCGEMRAEHYTEIELLWKWNYRYSISGTGQYGVKNYIIHDKSNKEQKYSALDEESKPILDGLVKERISVINKMLKLSKEIFFWDVYVPAKHYDIHYYPIQEDMDAEQIYEYIVEFGFANDVEHAEDLYGETVRSNVFDLPCEINERFDRLNEESFKEIVFDQMLTESDAIFHGFSD